MLSAVSRSTSPSAIGSNSAMITCCRLSSLLRSCSYERRLPAPYECPFERRRFQSQGIDEGALVILCVPELFEVPQHCRHAAHFEEKFHRDERLHVQRRLVPVLRLDPLGES